MAKQTRTTRPEVPDKRLTVDLAPDTNDRKPVFMFLGPWTGADLGNVKRHLTREYMMYVRDLRQKGAMINKPEGEQNA